MESNRFNSIDEYIANCPEDVQQKLKRHARNHPSRRAEGRNANRWTIS